MFQFQYRRQVNRGFVLGVFWLLGVGSAQAGTCEADKGCRSAAQRAYDAVTSEERQRSIAELQAHHQRTRDPRLLAGIGRLYQKEGKNRQAVEYCEKAKGLLPDDAEVQRKTGECLDRARGELLAKEKATGSPTVNRVEAKGGNDSVHSSVLVDNNNQPVITVSPTNTFQVTIPPAAQAVPMVNPAVSAPAAEQRSIGKQWWLWTGIGVVVAGAVGLGVGVGVAGREPDRGNTMVRPFSLSIH